MQTLGRYILIKPDKLPERTEAGVLIIPKNSTEMLPEWGTIIDVGPACVQARIGERANFPRKSANVIVIDDEDFYIIPEHKLYYHE